MMPVSRQTIAGPPADKKTVTHPIGPFWYLSIRFGQILRIPLARGEIGSSVAGAFSATLAIGESLRDI
jgi:hypothetical protein